MSIPSYIALFLAILVFILFMEHARGEEYDPCGTWCLKTDKGYTIRDRDNIRRGTITRDRRNGGYVIRDRDGIRRGKIDTGNDLLTSDRYNIQIEKRR